jgi:hypothetical protein
MLSENCEDWISQHGRPSWRTHTYLAYVVASIRQHGWTSRSAAGIDPLDVATADDAFAAMTKKAQVMLPGQEADKPTDEDYAKAQRVFAWVREVLAHKENLNDYEWNLLVAVNEFVEWRELGIVASAVVAYDKAQARARQVPANGGSPNNGSHFGTVGDRVELTLTVMMVRELAARQYAYGDSAVQYLHKFQDEAGHVFTWFTKARQLEEGRAYQVRATIKKHGDFKGAPETVLTRCHVID